MTPRKKAEVVEVAPLTKRQLTAQREKAKKAKLAAASRIKKQREKVKVLAAKLKAEEKELAKLLPKPKTNHIAGVVRSAKKAKKLDGLSADRTVKPIEFIDGLESILSYLIVSHKMEDKQVRLGVRSINDRFRMHFYPNIAAHGIDMVGKLRTHKGYETKWVSYEAFKSILDELRNRNDTCNLPQDLVEKLVETRRTSDSAEYALASV